MKKGFTLIEIIISISLLLFISISITFFVLKNNENDLTSIEKEIASAANLFLSLEYDKNSNTYLSGIQSGGKGIYLNIDTLVSKGYLDEKIIESLEKETKINRDKLKLLAVNAVGTENSEECGGNLIEYKFNWNVDSYNPIYLCPYDIKGSSTNETALDKILNDNVLNTELVTDETCKNGLFIDMDNYGATFFFRGEVENNYIKYGKYEDGSDVLWRIVRVNGDKTLRLILNENINYNLIDYDGNDIDLPKPITVKKIRYYYDYNVSSVVDKYVEARNTIGEYFINIVYHQIFRDNYYITYDFRLKEQAKINNQLFDLDIPLGNSSVNGDIYSSNNYIYKIANNWKNTIIDIDKYLADNSVANFCFSNLQKDSGTKNYLPNVNFKCDDLNIVSNENSTYGNNTLINISLGFLQYGEYNMATNKESCGYTGYLYDNNKYLLGNLYNEEGYYYYFSGLKSTSIGSRSSDSDSDYKLCTDNTQTKCYYFHKKDINTISFPNIRPVINIKGDVKLIGNGTINNPYQIEENK